MGANSSKQSSKIKQTLSNTISNTCAGGAIGTNKIDGLKIIAKNCKNISIKQGGKVYAKCDINTAASAVAKSIAQLENKQKAGLGINTNSQKTEQEQELKTKILNKCGSTAKISNELKNSTFVVENCDDLSIAQNASADVQCVMKAVTDMTSSAKSDSSSSQTGYDPMMLVMAFGFCIVACGIGSSLGAFKILENPMVCGGILCIVCMLIAGAYFKSTSANGSGTGGSSNGGFGSMFKYF